MKRGLLSILTLVLIVIAAGCSKGTKVNTTRLTGLLDAVAHDTIYLYGTDRFYDKIDTIILDNEGQFSHELVVDTPIIANLILDKNKELLLFISPYDKLEISKALNSDKYIVKGSTLNEEFNLIEDKIQSLADTERIKVVKTHIENNPNSLTSIALLYKYYIQQENPNYEEIDSIVDGMTGFLKDRQAITRITDQLDRASKAKEKRSALFFNLPNTKGTQTDKKEFKDKVLLLYFWASWDDKSRELNQQLKLINKKWGKNKNFALVGISLDKDTIALKEVIKKDSITWTQLMDRTGWQSEVADRYGIMKLPTTFLIDKTNAIIARDLEIDSLTQFISTTIKP